jgi:tetratricopeptide (TPR) repeat protein
MMGAINERIMKFHEDHPPKPGDLNAMRERSVALDQQGRAQSVQGDLPRALKSYRDSLAIREKLVKQDPANAHWQQSLSRIYRKLGNVQRDQGDLRGALKSFSDGLAIIDQLTKRDRTNADWQHDLAVSYENVGNVQSDQHDVRGALQSYRDSLGIFEKLAS